jgi:hypothetical protein
MGVYGSRLLRYPWKTEAYLKILEAAIGGTTLNYMDLPGGRFHLGKYLARIAAEEARQGRPPLTAVVVEKRTGRPASGFIEAMRDVGYVQRDTAEDEDLVWRRAISEVHSYWRRT